jgi:hypothetical protein
MIFFKKEKEIFRLKNLTTREEIIEIQKKNIVMKHKKV